MNFSQGDGSGISIMLLIDNVRFCQFQWTLIPF